MSWNLSGVVEKRSFFVKEWLSENWTMTQVCARHGISRLFRPDLLSLAAPSQFVTSPPGPQGFRAAFKLGFEILAALGYRDSSRSA